jgi:hypothetical protein
MKVKSQKMISGNREKISYYCDFIHVLSSLPRGSKRSEKMKNEFFYGS